MTTELLIGNKQSGKIYDLARATQQAQWTTERTGTPGKFSFTLLNERNLAPFSEGDVVRFSQDGQLQFYGWVFTKKTDRYGVCEVTCYDRLRYFKANASYAFYGMTASAIIAQIAGDLQIDLGALADTGYAIPSLIEEDQSCLDIIGSAIQQTLLSTGEIYVFFDNGQGVSLARPADMISGVVIGEQSLLTEYTYQSDIDAQTYNSIKLARPNEQTGRTDTFVVQDGQTIGQWGLLQLYQQVDGSENDAQVMARAQATLDYYNRPMRTLSVQSLGVPGLRAGQLVLMRVNGPGGVAIDQYVLLEKVSHTWENEVHTMSFDTLAL